MICLCCGKIIKNNAKSEEITNEWHNSCIRRFFGTKTLPELELTDEIIEHIANESTRLGFTVPGVQKKLSLHLMSDNHKENRLTLIGYPAGYILKPQTIDYPALPEAEFLVMQMAKSVGIKTVPFALIRMRENKQFAYITKRIDRTDDGFKIAMEDFCQLDHRVTADKYKGSYERCAKIVYQYSENPGLDIAELFLRIVFSFTVGNSDMHLKNFSLIEKNAGNGHYRLSEAYDMLPVNVILPTDNDQMALTLNGKNRNLHRNDFLLFAERSDLNRKSAEKLIDSIVAKKEVLLDLCQASFLPDDLKHNLAQLIEERINACKSKN